MFLWKIIEEKIMPRRETRSIDEAAPSSSKTLLKRTFSKRRKVLDQKRKMENEIKTTRDPNIQEDIQMIRSWLQKQPHMPLDIDDEFLMPYLCGTKSVEIAKQKLESYCMLHNKYPDNFSFQFRDPLDPHYQDSRKMGKIFILPQTTPEGYRVFMSTGGDFNKFDGFRSNVLISMMMETAMMMFPDSPGLLIAFDCKEVDSRLLTRMSFAQITFFLEYFQSAIPMKMKKMVIYNIPSFFEGFFNTFVKPFAKKKFLDRLILSSKGEEILKKYLSLDILPCDIEGGKASSSAELDDEWKRILESRRDYFEKASTFATDETKRPRDSAHTYGVDGTFRMLSVD